MQLSENLAHLSDNLHSIIHKKDGSYADYEDFKHNGGNYDFTLYVYDYTTKIVYYFFRDSMCPYISENGKYCRFIDNKFVEIN